MPAENRTPLPRLKAWDPDHWTTGTLQRRVVRRRLRALSRLSYRRTNGGLDSNQRPRAFKACSLHGIRCMESGRVELHTPRGAHPLATGLDPGSNHSPESWSGRKRSRSPRLSGAHRFRDGLGPRPIFLPWIRRPGVAPGPHRGMSPVGSTARDVKAATRYVKTVPVVLPLDDRRGGSESNRRLQGDVVFTAFAAPFVRDALASLESDATEDGGHAPHPWRSTGAPASNRARPSADSPSSRSPETAEAISGR